MTITITEKEYKAISFAIDKIEEDVGEGTNEEFAAEATKHQAALNNIMKKYKKAREKSLYFQMIRAEISKHNRHLRPKDIDKLTRKYIIKMKYCNL